MSPGTGFDRLLRCSLNSIALCGVLVAVCYYFVDRPVAFFVHRHGFSHYAVLKWLTYPPPIMQAWAPALLVGLMVRRAWGPFSRWECVLLAAGVSIVLADQFRESLADLMGRDWPETWIDDNPSLIRDNAYGFHPFEKVGFSGSFPSGHMARLVAAAAVFWIAYPRWRWVCIVATVLLAVGLLGMNYHFVGDIVAGGFVGGIVGT